jgi:hypothetical protein
VKRPTERHKLQSPEPYESDNREYAPAIINDTEITASSSRKIQSESKKQAIGELNKITVIFIFLLGCLSFSTEDCYAPTQSQIERQYYRGIQYPTIFVGLGGYGGSRQDAYAH